MPSFTPTIIINTTPAVTATTANPNLTYEMFRESLGNFAYDVTEFYLGALSNNQAMGVATYNYLSATGVQRYINLTPILDPNQFQPRVYYDSKFAKLILDGNSQVSFRLLPYETINLTLYTERMDNQAGLQEPDNFKMMGKMEDMPQLFGDWNEVI